MTEVRRGRPRSRDIPSQVMHCDYHGQDCEHRQWRRGLDTDGNPRLVWVCTQKQNETNKAAYAAKSGGA